MKIFTNAKSGFLKAALILAMACPMAVSCYDDSELREQIDLIVDKLYELEEKLNNEVAALQAMLRGNAMIKTVSTDTDGVTTVVLTDGTELVLYPKTDLQSMLTYMEASVDGENKNCWAYIDENGIKRFLRDSEGNPIPVEAELPEFIERDGETYLVIGGVEYPISGSSVFSDYELVTDELTGEVYAVTFTFGGDMTFTVTVDGACGFYFVAPTGGFGQSVIINDCFVASGTTESVQFEARGVADYVLQIPDGWRVKENVDIYMGTKYFQITAPKKELIESGVAAADGDLKVLAVFEGGKSTVSRLYVTTEPFETLNVSYGKADVKMYNGLQKFVYGVCPAAEYDEAAIFEVAEGLLAAYEYPAGYGMSTEDLSAYDLDAFSGYNLVAGEKYVFWTLPALYYLTAEDAGYYVSEGTFETVEFVYASVDFAVSNESFRDAKLAMALEGVTSYYADVVPAEFYMLDDVLYSLNMPGYYEARTSPLEYEGSVFEFAGIEGEKATDYVAWIAVAKESGEYTASDVVVVEFSTLNLTSGGNVTVTVAEENVQTLDVIATLSAAGAETMYYNFLTAAEAKKYADDEAKAGYLFENGKSVKAETAQVKASESISKMKPETDYVLFAVASDAEGKYGQVMTKEYKTKEIVYNDLTVALEVVVNDPGNVAVKVTSEGAVDFVYWVGKISDNTWKSSNYLGGSPETAQVYMYLNQTATRFVTMKEKYPIVDGIATMTDLGLKEDCVFVAMAKDADGVLSKAFHIYFTTRSIALGDIVYDTDSKWSEAAPVLNWIPEGFEPATGMMMGKYTFTFDCPDHLTAYVLCGAQSYLDDGGNIQNMTVADEIIKIVEMTDKKSDKDLLVDSELWESTGSMDAWKWFRFSHGCALFGNAVIYGEGAHVHEDCEMCSTYTGNSEIVVYKAAEGPVEFRQPYANAKDDVDKVYVVYKDIDGNFYQPHVVDVPDEYFEVEVE
ncbi:MAG: hypothetical protein IJ307_05350 [Bacteroidales bacterium]|nr:hypothetical protein [Bacteroidales bacterium]